MTIADKGYLITSKGKLLTECLRNVHYLSNSKVHVSNLWTNRGVSDALGLSGA